MTLTRKSVALLVLALSLGGVWGLGTLQTPDVPTLPATQQVLPAQVTRVVVTSASQKIVLARGGTDPKSAAWQRWTLEAPIQGAADAAQVSALLRTFGPGIPMLAEAGEADAKTYGFDNDTAITVELYTGQDTPAVSLIVGKPAGGPTAFVRMAGSDTAFRADIGGRARYERPAADWRDKVMLDVATDDVAELVLARLTDKGPERLRFTRGPSIEADKDGNPVPGPWTLAEGGPKGFVADDATVGRIVGVLGGLRAGMIHNPEYEAGFSSSPVTAELVLRDATRHRIVLGARGEEGAAFVKVDDRREVFRVAAQVGRLLTVPTGALADRTIFTFQPSEIASVAYADGGLTVVLEQSSDGARTWTVAQPANMDADQGSARQLAEGLASLRADAFPADGAFTPSGGTLTVRFRDGRASTLELGALERDADNRPLVRVRADGRTYLLGANVVQELRRAFGRAP